MANRPLSQWTALLGAGAMLISGISHASQPVQAPVAEQIPYTVKSANGDRVDPYYWMRDDKRQDPKVLAHLQAENAYYQQYADKYQDLTNKLTDEIIGRIKQDDSSVPAKKGDYSFYTRYETGQQYPVYLRKALKTGEEQVILDVNKMAAGKDFYQVGNYAVSPDNNLVAYAEDTNGRRQYTVRVRDLRTGKDLPDVLTGVEASLAWSSDRQAFVFILKKINKHY